MLRIRLQRRGRRKRPLHHIVVADSRKPRDGRIIEDLGRFDNVTPKNQLTLNRDRAIHWLKQGAQPTDTVRSIFKKQGIMYEMHLLRWGKSEEEIEAALTEWREAREAKEKDVPTRKERQKALLEAEEKEYQKQLKKKAEEAAKEKAKQEALASDEDEEDEGEETKAEADEEGSPAPDSSRDSETEVAEEEAQAEKETAEAETQEEDADDDADEAEAAEEDKEPEAEAADESEKESADEQETEAQEEEAEETDEEPKAEAKEEDSSDDEEETEAEAAGQTSSDMLAKEAIKHIENTPLEDLKGFVTDDEDRVTVQRAWDAKQEEE